MKIITQLTTAITVFLVAAGAQAQHLPKAQHELLADTHYRGLGLLRRGRATSAAHQIGRNGAGAHAHYVEPHAAEGAGLPAAQVEQSLRDITDKVTIRARAAIF